MSIQRFLFCPGAIVGKRGWTPVVRVSRDGKPIGSKTCEPFATREEAVAHATQAAHRAAKAVENAFSKRATFTVREPVAFNPVADAHDAILDAIEGALLPIWHYSRE